jgi:hypothetical protein
VTRRGSRGLALAAVAVALALLLPATSQAITYAPPDQPGPPLCVPQADLDWALSCTGGI